MVHEHSAAVRQAGACTLEREQAFSTPFLSPTARMPACATLVILWTMLLANQIRVFATSGSIAQVGGAHELPGQCSAGLSLGLDTLPLLAPFLPPPCQPHPKLPPPLACLPLRCLQWYFSPPSLAAPRGNTLRSLKHALGPSFGSLCLSSLVLTVSQLMREALEQAQQDNNGNVVMMCLNCLAQLFWSIIEYLTKVGTGMVVGCWWCCIADGRREPITSCCRRAVGGLGRPGACSTAESSSTAPTPLHLCRSLPPSWLLSRARRSWQRAATSPIC